MSDFELGMMAGWAMGVVTAGAIAGTLDWWRGRNRVVTIHTTSQSCEQVWPDEGFDVDGVITRRGPIGKVECCVCDGTGVKPYFPGRGYKGPNTIPCGLCKGTGWMTPPPKKP